MKEKNYCDKCESVTWHNYEETTTDRDGYTECTICSNRRYFDNLKYKKVEKKQKHLNTLP